jgi:adenosylmethionine-8-amino-7-oxononanoate aminotransferase
MRALDDLRALLERRHEHIAAFIYEPLVQGAAGMAMYHPAYLTRVRALCDHYQVHLIADEIAVGFGRTGTMFAFEQAPPLPLAGSGTKAVTPDFICLSKGITGGYLPLSAVLTTDDVYAAFYDDATARGFLHSHSYTGNPLACRAALAVLDIFEHDQVIAANRVKSIEFTGILAEVATHPRVRHFRHLGMIWAFEVADATAGFSTRFHQAALAQGVFMRPIGNTVYAMPPYVTRADEMRGLADVMLVCLDNPEI